MAMNHLRIRKPRRRRRSERSVVCRRWHPCADAGMSQTGGADALLSSVLDTPPLPLPALLTYILQHPGYITGQGC